MTNEKFTAGAVMATRLIVLRLALNPDLRQVAAAEQALCAAQEMNVCPAKELNQIAKDAGLSLRWPE